MNMIWLAFMMYMRGYYIATYVATHLHIVTQFNFMVAYVELAILLCIYTLATLFIFY